MDYLAINNPNISAVTALIGGPLLAFFQAPVLMYLLLFVVIDFATGIWKAWLIKKIASSRFGDVFSRGVVYIIIYFILQGLGTVLPAISFFESIVMVGYMTKEALSILENLRAIQMVTGKGPDISFIIDKLGIDLKRIVTEVETGFTDQVRMNPGNPKQQVDVHSARLGEETSENFNQRG
jgi:toxin secretion/phage lysis holin